MADTKQWEDWQDRRERRPTEQTDRLPIYRDEKKTRISDTGINRLTGRKRKEKR